MRRPGAAGTGWGLAGILRHGASGGVWWLAAVIMVLAIVIMTANLILMIHTSS